MRGDKINGAPNGVPEVRSCCPPKLCIPGDNKRDSAADCAKRLQSSSQANIWASVKWNRNLVRLVLRENHKRDLMSHSCQVILDQYFTPLLRCILIICNYHVRDSSDGGKSFCYDD